MKVTKVRFKKLSEQAVEPMKAHSTDAGFDLVGVRRECDYYGVEVWHTDIAVEIPKGYVGYIFPRSSISNKGRMVANCVGVIDSGYTGEITVKMHSTTKLVLPKPKVIWKYLFGGDLYKAMTYDIKRIHFWNCDDSYYKEGDRIAQLIIMPIPTIKFEEAEELEDSERGTGGYGSTGN